MTLIPSAMAATMLAKALSAGLFDKPPNFALSRVYSVLATGIVRTAITPVETITMVNYFGQPSAPAFGTATIQGVTGMDHDGYRDRTMTASLFTGPFAFPFFEGIAGCVDYFQAQVTLLDLFAPVGTQGQGTLVAGGIHFDAGFCFDNIHSAAKDAKIMVVDVDIHLHGDPNATIPDPVTQTPLHKGDFFSQAEALVLAVSTQFQVEVAKAAQATIPVVGPFHPPPTPPITATTVTTVLL